MQKLMQMAEKAGMTLRDYLIEKIPNYSSKREAANGLGVSRSTLDVALARCDLEIKIKAIVIEDRFRD